MTISSLSAYQAARSKRIEPLLLTSSSVPAAAPGRAGPSGAAGRTLFASRSRFPCSPDRISQNPCSVQLIDGFIIQSQRFLQSLLTVTVSTLRDALIVVQISQELTGSAQRIRPLSLQHGGVGQEHPVLLPDVLQGFGKVVVILHGGAISISHKTGNIPNQEK